MRAAPLDIDIWPFQVNAERFSAIYALNACFRAGFCPLNRLHRRQQLWLRHGAGRAHDADEK